MGIMINLLILHNNLDITIDKSNEKIKSILDSNNELIKGFIG